MAVRLPVEDWDAARLDAAKKKVQAISPELSVFVKKVDKKWVHVELIPCHIEDEVTDSLTHKGVQHRDWRRKIRFAPELFDLESVDVVKDWFVPTRKKVKQCIFFSMQTKMKEDEKTSCFMLETLHVYLEDNDPKHPKPESERVKDLSTSDKEKYVQKATAELIKKLLQVAKPEIKLMIEAAYAAARIVEEV